MVANARVLSVDDEEFIAETVRRILSREQNLVFVGSLVSADELRRGVEQTHANIVLLDLNMPGRDPLEAIGELRAEFPSIRVIILSGDRDPALVRRAFNAGASGFISKDEPLPVIASEIRRAAEGQSVVSPLIREMMGLRFHPETRTDTGQRFGNENQP